MATGDTVDTDGVTDLSQAPPLLAEALGERAVRPRNPALVAAGIVQILLAALGAVFVAHIALMLLAFSAWGAAGTRSGTDSGGAYLLAFLLAGAGLYIVAPVFVAGVMCVRRSRAAITLTVVVQALPTLAGLLALVSGEAFVVWLGPPALVLALTALGWRSERRGSLRARVPASG